MVSVNFMVSVSTNHDKHGLKIARNHEVSERSVGLPGQAVLPASTKAADSAFRAGSAVMAAGGEATGAPRRRSRGAGVSLRRAGVSFQAAGVSIQAAGVSLQAAGASSVRPVTAVRVVCPTVAAAG